MADGSAAALQLLPFPDRRTARDGTNAPVSRRLSGNLVNRENA